MAVRRCLKDVRQLRIVGFTMSSPYSTTQNVSASTIDNKEISHFQKSSSNWWNSSITRPLIAMNQLRVPFIRDGLINTGVVKKENVNMPEPLRGLKILDVGCGGGILSEALARLGCTVIGLDATPDLINIAKQHATLDTTLTNLTYECSSIENHAISNAEQYDALVSSEVIEHVTEKKLFIENCVKCIKPGGSIFITTLNKTSKAWFVGIILAEYVVRALPKGTHQWDKFIAPHQLQRELEDFNCHTTVVHGMWYNFFSNTWRWTSDKSMSYALQAVKD